MSKRAWNVVQEWTARVPMILRFSKTLLVAAVAFFHTLVILNTLTDSASNDPFVQHVLLRDSTLPGHHDQSREVHLLWIHALCYDLLLRWEAVSLVLTGAGLIVSPLLWFVAFLSVRGSGPQVAVAELESRGRRSGYFWSWT